ncbi:hypothetical protein K504DRAFT_229901 [Pleomassaria siparia CBS 279.74]|uniref:Zn(2)-C6 fungal-type domain-containing protein n=1 Tax=Pleomassaria siparia CBS 279.74 TaxID=1314801 RepID=A0A6G1KHC7_9PLEO|nr:hypothetical protein K504DRAFT_229901 [Pleomassaria siparia CBS 279.74]
MQKQEGVKCDKAQGTCHQCITANAECVYIERRKRRRLAQPENGIGELARRLEYIEKHISNTESASLSTTPSVEPPTSVSITAADILRHESPNAPPEPENGPDSWIYRLAVDAKRNFERVNTPVGTDVIDTSMSQLSQALEALGRLRIRSNADTSQNHSLNLTPEQGKECVDQFLSMVHQLLVPSIFDFCSGLDVLQHIPSIISSPYVSIEPCVRVAYYNALYYGLYKIHGPGNDLAQAAYFKLLESVPAWLAVASGSIMDVCTAALTTWTTIANSDYQLSWKFHLKACHFIRLRSIHKLDVRPSLTHEEEDARHGLRYMFFFLMQTDLMFRLFFDKPPGLHWKSAKDVKVPQLFMGSNVNINAPQVIVYFITIKYTVLTTEMFNLLDAMPTAEWDEAIHKKVDEYCIKLEELVTEWDLGARTETSEQQPVYADHLMNIYSSIIGIKRLTRAASDPSQAIDAITLRAARKVISTVLRHTGTAVKPHDGIVFVHFISFYPFSAVFSLYEHILACTHPSKCASDLQALENMEALMDEACSVRVDLVPFSKIITALNKVSRAMQEKRQQEHHHRSGITQVNNINGDANTKSRDQPLPSPQFDATGQQPVSMASFQDLLSLDMNGSGPGPGSDFPFLSDYGANNEAFQPLPFVRALENDFIGRNWHETWWNMDGDGNADLGEGFDQ